MKHVRSEYRVRENRKVTLKRWPTRVKLLYRSKAHYRSLLAEQVEQLSTLQRLLYASNRFALLVISQAMDAAGKDGAIRHVMSGVNPQYRKAYEECLGATSTAASPWYVVPADDKENARLIVSRIIVDTMAALGMSYPTLSDARLRELQSIRKALLG